MSERVGPQLSPAAEAMLSALTVGEAERGLHELLAELLADYGREAEAADMGVDLAGLTVAVRHRVERGDTGDLWSRRKLIGRAVVRAQLTGRLGVGPADLAAVLLEAGRALVSPAAGTASSPARPPARRPGAAGAPPPTPPPVPVEAAAPEADAGSPVNAASESRVRTFRVFVSSTFDDMAAERDGLARLAWPRLREFCAARSARFQAIDLRWGVSEEAALDQQTMNLCLGEVRRCHEVTPRPNFLVLVGNHYGWRPLPPQIPAEEFERLQALVAEEGARALLREWYELDLNAVPPERRLRPRVGEFVDRDAWSEVEARLRAIVDGAIAALQSGPRPLEEARLMAYRASATEQEIRTGALVPDRSEGSAFWVQRDVTGEAPPGQADEFHRRFRDADQGPIERLRSALQERLGDPVGRFAAPWDPGRGRCGSPSDGHVQEMAEAVASALEKSIARELEEPGRRREVSAARPVPGDESLGEEGQEHRRFVEEHVQVFVGREAELARVDHYLAVGADRPLAVCAGGGSGKSSFMAEAVRRALTSGRQAVVVYRFIGATPGSSDGRSLLDGICRELARRTGGDESAVPGDHQGLIREFQQRLGAGAAARPVVVFIDSLDQLSAADGARSLHWVPSPLPAHARLVISTRDAGADGHPLDTFQALRGRAEVLGLPPLPLNEAAELLDAWLQQVGRTLQPGQRQAVLDAFTLSPTPADVPQAPGGAPLYLRLAFEEARRWASGDGRPPRSLSPGLGPLIRENLFARFAWGAGHGPVLVARALGYLAASRFGLAEDELVDLLSRDLEVYRWFVKDSKHLPPDLIGAAAAYRPRHEGSAGQAGDGDAGALWLEEARREGGEALDRFLDSVITRPDGPRLPVVLWSRLGSDLRPYLTERRSEAGPLLDFSHQELQEAARSAYASGGDAARLHGHLADYFAQQADPAGERRWVGSSGRPHLRGLSELPYHLTRAGRWDDLMEVLTDFTFLEQKATHVGRVARGAGDSQTVIHTGVYQLQDDFALAAAEMPGGEIGRERSRPIVTGVDLGEGLVLRCPHCNALHPFRPEWKGRDIHCPNPVCGGRLKVNPFVVEQ